MTRITANLTRALAAATVVSTLVACSNRNENLASDTATGMVATDTAATATTAGVVDRDLSEGGIIGLLRAANAGEVEAANVALQKAKNAQVRQFAQLMKDEHTAMLSKTDQLGQSLAVNPVVPRDEDKLVKDHRENMEELSKDDEDFDQEYMDAQIEEHEEALNIIDKSLENTQNAELRQLLQEARPKVEQHLTQARQIKDQID
jgi:putative membrane protein